ncbi:MAG: hypothetical protein PW734_04480 [Verrucomicrobium sp.]|nr:hypothetical protein [Verrucomicrobium sp.]
MKLKLESSKPMPLPRQEKDLKDPVAAAPLVMPPPLPVQEKTDLRREQEMAQVLEAEALRDLRAFVAAYPHMADDPEVRALQAAIEGERKNRATPGYHTLQNRLREQRARVLELRQKLSEVEKDRAAEAAEAKGHSAAPLAPGKLPTAAFHPTSEHAEEYAVLAQLAHRATKRRNVRADGKGQVQSTDPQDDDVDDTGDSMTDPHGATQAATSFH